MGDGGGGFDKRPPPSRILRLLERESGVKLATEIAGAVKGGFGLPVGGASCNELLSEKPGIFGVAGILGHDVYTKEPVGRGMRNNLDHAVRFPLDQSPRYPLGRDRCEKARLTCRPAYIPAAG